MKDRITPRGILARAGVGVMVTVAVYGLAEEISTQYVDWQHEQDLRESVLEQQRDNAELVAEAREESSVTLKNVTGGRIYVIPGERMFLALRKTGDSSPDAYVVMDNPDCLYEFASANGALSMVREGVFDLDTEIDEITFDVRLRGYSLPWTAGRLTGFKNGDVLEVCPHVGTDWFGINDLVELARKMGGN